MTGQRFGYLVVRQRIEGTSPAQWDCQCDCGRATQARGDHLRYGATKSCGCYFRGVLGNMKRLHGLTHTPEYHSWASARGRCFNPNNPKYDRYGGRGITMCDRWRDGFTDFLVDMGHRPPGHSLNRIDNDGPYSPENCEWATMVTQCNNRRTTHTIHVGGRALTIAQAAAEFCLGYQTLLQRLRRGATPDDAVKPIARRAHGLPK